MNLAKTIIKGDYLPMNSIAQFIEHLKTLEKNIFLINTILEPLIINKSIPSALNDLLNNPELIELISNLISNTSELNNILDPIVLNVK